MNNTSLRVKSKVYVDTKIHQVCDLIESCKNCKSLFQNVMKEQASQCMSLIYIHVVCSVLIGRSTT